MNNTKSIERANEREMLRDLVGKGSWHEQYKDSPYIFVGGLSASLTEGDIRTVFSQYGEVVDVNLSRDKDSGLPRGFAFLAYADQRSTVLAVDNFNGITLADRTIRVDHVLNYRSPEDLEVERERRKRERTKYADMVTDELFKSAAGDLLTPADFSDRKNDTIDFAKKSPPHPHPDRDGDGEGEERGKERGQVCADQARQSKEERREERKRRRERKEQRREKREERRKREEKRKQRAGKQK